MLRALWEWVLCFRVRNLPFIISSFSFIVSPRSDAADVYSLWLKLSEAFSAGATAASSQ